MFYLKMELLMDKIPLQPTDIPFVHTWTKTRIECPRFRREDRKYSLFLDLSHFIEVYLLCIGQT